MESLKCNLNSLGANLEGIIDNLSRYQTIWCILSPTRDLQNFEFLVLVAFHA
jgi:hypothetical protein